MSIAQFLAVAMTLIALLVVIFWSLDHLTKNFDKYFGAGSQERSGLRKHYGTPPKQPTEDDPEFMEWVERKIRHLED